ncbi:rod-binding protein [Enterobacter cancerogenus]|jgi:peptidoglycan hydrolase FlgJ|uniref:Flagellar rod assembly protein FlgJ n=1 Tax=Enterobacter cancerogenus TaxID=69218 RepID=A0A484XT38_9ENTR|nr:rod-binding protein [Enterobacter cancerogenus]AUJ79836.1 peptidoglycan hydrolase [Enterobacter cancerogenus]EFC55223.1 putative peptidoglycan hydrolase [Enterobacter cancerogenus ATCC 35316]KTQ45256.1 peptidoglycan hydrolase [Enterobacter cancerogenus]KTQ47483.1 peptidoglycan hydrolase [Enterobacter cancerogenus]KTQ70840.1 peptidoglycan hydrolase [Enterobacter cancerogenus]
MLQAIHSQTSVLPGDITGQVKPQNLEQAAEQFEAMFLRSMMKQMRKASQALVDDNPFDSKQQRMMQEFYDDKLTSQLASQRSTGMAQMIIAQLGPQESASLKNGSRAVALEEHPQELKTPVVPVMRRGQE